MATVTIDAGSVRSVHVSLSANGFGHIATSSSGDLSQHADTSKAGIAVGWGLWLVLIAGVVLGLLGILDVLRRR